MILILGGTHEGKKVSRLMKEMGLTHQLSLATELGRKTYEDVDTPCIVRQFTETTLYNHVLSERVELIVDASHPHALEIKSVARAACEKAGIGYIRFERPSVRIETSAIRRIETFGSIKSIIQALKSREDPNDRYLITGTKHIEAFYESFSKEKCIFRVMPSVYSLDICQGYKVPLSNIIAVKAPLPIRLNLSLFAAYGITHFIFKDSGEGSAYESNIRAVEKSKVQGLVLRACESDGIGSIQKIDQLKKILIKKEKNGGKYV